MGDSLTSLTDENIYISNYSNTIVSSTPEYSFVVSNRNTHLLLTKINNSTGHTISFNIPNNGWSAIDLRGLSSTNDYSYIYIGETDNLTILKFNNNDGNVISTSLSIGNGVGQQMVTNSSGNFITSSDEYSYIYFRWFDNPDGSKVIYKIHNTNFTATLLTYINDDILNRVDCISLSNDHVYLYGQPSNINSNSYKIIKVHKVTGVISTFTNTPSKENDSRIVSNNNTMFYLTRINDSLRLYNIDINNGNISDYYKFNHDNLSAIHISLSEEAFALPDKLYLFGAIVSNNVGYYKLSAKLRPPTLGSFSIPNQIASDGTITIAPPSSDSSAPFTYTSSDTSVATISGNIITVKNDGNTTITAFQNAISIYSAASIEAPLVINRLTPTIGSFVIPRQTYHNNSFNITIVPPSSSSVASFTYTSSDTSVATISGTTLTIVGVGFSTITAIQNSNATHKSISIQTLLSVDKNERAILVKDYSYQDNSFDLDVNNIESANTIISWVPTGDSVIKIDLTNKFILNYTEYNSIYLNGYGMLGFNSASNIGTLPTDMEASNMVAFFLPVGDFNGMPIRYFENLTNKTFTVIYSGRKTGPYNKIRVMLTMYLNGTQNYGLTTVNFGDMYNVETSKFGVSLGSGDSNNFVSTLNFNANTTFNNLQFPYFDATNNKGMFSNKKMILYLTPRINPALGTFSIPMKTFGESDFEITPPQSNSVGLFTYTSSNQNVATISGNTLTIVGTGSTTITANQESANIFISGLATTELNVDKATTVISLPFITTKTFGDGSFQIDAITNSDAPVIYTSSNTSVATILGNIVTIVGAGNTTITATQLNNDNYT